jgi:transcriptional regulator with XRE-family HTH domain
MEALMDLKSESHPLGEVLRQARVAKALSREQVAAALKLHPSQLEALETGSWQALPQGGVRPLMRQLAEHLEVDLAEHVEAFEALPGLPEPAPVDPQREKQERWAVAGLSVLCLLLAVWLLVPGPSLRAPKAAPSWLTEDPGPYLPPPPPPPQVPYPVLGELMPEAPFTTEGALVVLRAQDAAQARIEGEGGLKLERHLQVSEPWKLRVKGAFTLHLENAGVVRVEVAGHAIEHGAAVGEDWDGRFDDKGAWQKPAPPPLPRLQPPSDPEEPTE